MSDEHSTNTKYEKTINLAKLKPSDYRMWVSQVEATLAVYNCYNIVTGAEIDPTPADGNVTPTLRKQMTSWKIRHDLAREALLRSLERSELLKVHNLRNASEIWNRLRVEYGGVSDVLRAKAELHFHSLRKDPKTTLQNHIDEFTKLQEAVDYHAPPGTPQMSKSQINLAFLRSLGKPWETFQQAMGDKAHDITTGELFARVKAIDEARDDEPSESTIANARALSTRISDSSVSRSNNRSYRGGFRGNGSFSRSYGSYRGGGRFRGGKRFPTNYPRARYCQNCKRIGHTREQCHRRRYYRNGNGNRDGNGDVDYQPNFNFQANVTQLSQCSLCEPVRRQPGDPYEWIVDSAANVFVMPYKNRIQNYRPFEEACLVRGIGGKSVLALGSGRVTLTDICGFRYTLKNVLYVPDAETPILSLMQLRNQGIDFEFLPEGSPDGDFILVPRELWRIEFTLHGQAIDNILYVHETPTQPTALVTTRSQSKRQSPSPSPSPSTSHQTPENDQPIKRQRITTSSIDQPISIRESLSATPSSSIEPLRCRPHELWHLRFAHASNSTLRNLPLIKSSYNTTDCQACIQAKQHRNPFQATSPTTKEVGDLIHSDLCGPFPLSKGNSKYSLTFLDDFSHYITVYTIPNKLSLTVQEYFARFVITLETQTGRKVKRLRTDGGGEYGGALTPFLQSLGVTHESTAPYTPQSNGKAERINRTLNKSVRAMLFHANMPESFWAEAIVTAAYVWNFLPSNAIGGQIPYELWFNQRINPNQLSALKPFGCIVHNLVPKQRCHGKLASQSTRGCIVGYHSSTSYKIWDFERQCFDNTHDYIIRETEFPTAQDFGESSQQSTPPSSAPSPETEREIFDEIEVLPPPSATALSIQRPEFGDEPASFSDALQSPIAQKWIDAMKAEFQSISANKTWTLCDLPPGRKCIGTKWVFRIKRDGNNNIERYKSRIVAKGYAQIAGLDFEKTFAPVVRIESVRCLFAIAAFLKFYLLHIDCKTAFLNGRSDLELYVSQPEGFIDKRFPRKVLRLNKSLYGLKQAPRIWYLLLCSVITSLGFAALETDPSIYINANAGIIIAVYVDDILVLAQHESQCLRVFDGLSNHFEVQNKGAPKTFLGLNIIRKNPSSITINQSGYIDRLLSRFNMTNAVTAPTPLNASLPLVKAQPIDRRINVTEYQELIGSLNHAAVFSRPDISYAVSQLSQFLTDPSSTHLVAAKRVLRYLKATRNLSITYGGDDGNNLQILGFADANWAADRDDRKSITGYVFAINNGPVSWTSHKQSTIAHSSTEAEYMSLSDASREAIARTHLFKELNILQITNALSLPPVLFCDNQGALTIAENPTNYQRSKHIDLRYHFIRQTLERGQISIDYLSTDKQPADVLTKALGPLKHRRCVDLLGLEYVD